jgi:lantibiotic biosynthesis protein
LSDLGGRAVSVAKNIANRLRVTGLSGVDANCGAAMLFDELDRLEPGSDWAFAAKEKLATAVAELERTENRNLSLYNGFSTLGFAAWRLSRDGARYSQILAEVDRWVVERAGIRGQELVSAPGGRASDVFDVVTGLAGIGAYLMCRPATSAALIKVLRGLVAVCSKTGGYPNWHTSAEGMTRSGVMRLVYPNGMVNCGLAHGVPGPLALLCLTMANGVSVAGQYMAIQRVANWLAEHRADDDWGPNWPSGFPLNLALQEPTHNAWCYGSPGIANALLLAADTLDDDDLRKLAVESMAAVYRRGPDARMIDRSPGLCHGVGGLLMITLRFAQTTAEPVFTSATAALTEQLLAMYDPDLLYGYEFLANDGATVQDQPDFLNGAAGVALTLLAAAGPGEHPWDRMLLLS